MTEEQPSWILLNLDSDSPGVSQCHQTSLSWNANTKLDPSGGGKGGPISKLEATLNKVVFRRLSKLNLFSYASSLLIAI